LSFSITTRHTFRHEKIPGQLYVNRHFDQLSRSTPPAIVSRERRAAPAPPPSSPATTPPTIPIRRALPTSAPVQSGSVSSAQTPAPTRSGWQTRFFLYLLYFLPFAASWTLLPLFFAPASFIFSRLRPLLQKHRGVGVPRSQFCLSTRLSVSVSRRQTSFRSPSVVRKSARMPLC